MLRLHLARILGGALLTAAVLHVAWSFATGAYLAARHADRLPNLGRIQHPVANWIPMVSIYARRAEPPSTISIAVIGSSFTFGFALPGDVIFSHALKRLSPRWTILNLSIAAADQTGLSTMVGCALAKADSRFDVALIELPILNDNAQARSVAAQGRVLERDIDLRHCPPAVERTWLEYFLKRPYGLQWVPLLREEVFSRSLPLWLRPRGDGAERDDRPQRVRFPPDYVVDAATYGKIATDIAAARESYIGLMSRFARKTLVYPSLIQLDLLAEHGFERGNIQRQIADALAACRKVEGVICLDPVEFAGRADLYRDAAHLNVRGHESFGEWLFQRVRPLIEKPAG